jgi:hypothetical protein
MLVWLPSSVYTRFTFILRFTCLVVWFLRLILHNKNSRPCKGCCGWLCGCGERLSPHFFRYAIRFSNHSLELLNLLAVSFIVRGS